MGSKITDDLLGIDQPKPPKAPDYTGAAEQTAAGNLELAQYNTQANRVNQVTPWGNLTYNKGPNDQWTASVSLSPQQQQLLNAQNASNLQMAGMYKTLGNQVQSGLSSRIDPNGLPQQQVNAGQTAQDAIMARIQPALDKRQEALRTQMANQGVMQGSEAYKGSMDEFNRQANDAYIQAGMQGIEVGNKARQQALQEKAFLRNEPINQLNALRTGSQVQSPNFINAPQQQYVPGANYLGATQALGNYNVDLFNLNQAGANNAMGGLFSLGSSLIGAFA